MSEPSQNRKIAALRTSECVYLIFLLYNEQMYGGKYEEKVPVDICG